MAERTHKDKTGGPGRKPGRDSRDSASPGRTVDGRGRPPGRSGGPTPKGGRRRGGTGRYTAPIPATTRHSPTWYPWMLLSLLALGIAVIILNYVQVLPSSPTNWYTLGGIVSLLAGVLLATNYR